jgi:N-acetylneuraminic acid mutarotase
MKIIRLTLLAVLAAFVLLGGMQLNAHAASAPPPNTHCWAIGADRVHDHIWQSLGSGDNGATYAALMVAAPAQRRHLDYADRVAYQRAIEDVYWRHRIWRKQRPDTKPPLDAVMSQAAIEQKVADYLRDSERQEKQTPITPARLQAEMERMAQHTRQPEVLRELFAALGNDPFVIAECLARPVLVGRLQFSTAEERREAAEPRGDGAREQSSIVMAAATTNYSLPAVTGQPSECTASWIATSTTDAPAGRKNHTAVWTGSEMIVWGGWNVTNTPFNTGGRYNPSTDSWTPTSTTNAPSARNNHTAVWTGTEMIVWGGFPGTISTGGRYNPITDTWTATSTTNAPAGRANHTAVWTGSEMIVWGGYPELNTGGRYNPDTDSWTPTSTVNAPTARGLQKAVWTGHEMIIWGGVANANVPLKTGGRYDPITDSWTATTTTNAPDQRYYHTAVWTGSEMIVWGGYPITNTGGRYNPDTDSWTATSRINAPTARDQHTAVWSGTEMIVWGGSFVNTGGKYNPMTDSWTATSTTGAPTGTFDHTAVWTGTEMIVWGGYAFPQYLNTGGRYCPEAGGPISLAATTSKVDGINTVLLTWSGATSTDIDVYRDSMLIATTPNSGTYTDSTGDTGRARYRYKVCEAGTSNCSNIATAKFRN